MTQVSVIMPVYNGAKHIREAIDSVINQTFCDWDFWIINEYGSNDGSAQIVEEYAQKDSRFHFVQNHTRLGLAESLNLGFKIAKGKYLARLDADDLAHPERFQKQFDFMEKHPEIGICGTYQHHFGENVDWIHRPPVNAEDCKARLLFNCDLCHSTLFLRREVVIKNKLFYDNSFLAEDYELWCRAAMITKIANIPEVLGEYRWDGENITVAKKEKLNIESGKIVANNIENNLGIKLDTQDAELFQGWENPFDKYQPNIREAKLNRLEQILREIYEKNKIQKVYFEKSLLSVLAGKWRWAKFHDVWNEMPDIQEISQIFDTNYKPSLKIRYKNFCAHNKTLRSKLKKLIKVLFRPMVRPFRKRMEGLLECQTNKICGFVEEKTWDRYLRISKEIEALKDIVTLQNQTLENTMAFVDDRISKAEQLINQSTDARVWNAEKLINQTMDARVWNAEKLINQTMDARVWNAEKLINQTMDARVWNAEKLINQTMDARVWNAEKLINQTMDARVWNAESNLWRELVDRTNSQTWNLLYELTGDKQGTEQWSDIYDFTFYLENRFHSIISAQHVLPVVFQFVSHESIVDFGCGTGTWLWVAKSLGVKSFIGLDGDYVPRRFLMIPESCFRATNLENEVILEQKFDLAISMEVAEHLKEGAANTFVDSLCNCADVILFSAAHPGQGGDGHVNEQPLEYWIEKFAQKGYEYIQIRQLFENDSKIEYWYRENIVLFARSGIASTRIKTKLINITLP